VAESLGQRYQREREKAITVKVDGMWEAIERR